MRRQDAGFFRRRSARPVKNRSAAHKIEKASPPAETAPVSDAPAARNKIAPPAACRALPSLFSSGIPPLPFDGFSIADCLSVKTDFPIETVILRQARPEYAFLSRFFHICQFNYCFPIQTDEHMVKLLKNSFEICPSKLFHRLDENIFTLYNKNENNTDRRMTVCSIRSKAG